MSDDAVKGDDLFEMFSVNERDAEEGKWFKVGPVAEMKLRRFSSKASKKTRQNLEKPHREQYRGRDLPEDVMEDITNQHIAYAIIADWRGVVKAGKPLPYSKNAALDLMEKLPDLRTIIINLAVSLDQFRDADKEEGEGN